MYYMLVMTLSSLYILLNDPAVNNVENFSAEYNQSGG